MVNPVGVEPTTVSLRGCCSAGLSYESISGDENKVSNLSQLYAILCIECFIKTTRMQPVRFIPNILVLFLYIVIIRLILVAINFFSFPNHLLQNFSFFSHYHIDRFIFLGIRDVFLLFNNGIEY